MTTFETGTRVTWTGIDHRGHPDKVVGTVTGYDPATGRLEVHEDDGRIHFIQSSWVQEAL